MGNPQLHPVEHKPEDSDADFGREAKERRGGIVAAHTTTGQLERGATNVSFWGADTSHLYGLNRSDSSFWNRRASVSSESTHLVVGCHSLIVHTMAAAVASM